MGGSTVYMSCISSSREVTCTPLSWFLKEKVLSTQYISVFHFPYSEVERS